MLTPGTFYEIFGGAPCHVKTVGKPGGSFFVRGPMPTLSRFFGIIIRMNWNDHLPPHFHAEHGEYEAKYSLETLELLAGELKIRDERLVLAWAELHRAELIRAWNLVMSGQNPGGIDPLRK